MKYLKRFNEAKKDNTKETISLKEFIDDVYKYNPEFKEEVDGGDGLEYEVCFTLLAGYAEEFESGFPYKLVDSINDDDGDDDIKRSGIFKRLSDGKYFMLWVSCDRSETWKICKYLEEVEKKKKVKKEWK